MIQRIQTVYLALGAVLLIAMPFAGDLQAHGAAGLAWFLPAVLTAIGLSVLAAAGAVFLYGNRKRQRAVVIVAQLFAVVTVAVVFLGRNFAPAGASADSVGAVDEWLVLLMPVAAYVLFWLGRRAIERDIALVRSMDRLR